MAVISVSITESTDQVVAGIPRNVAINTNISASIFYTLDGSDPTLFSDIYIDPIFLPTDTLSVTLKVMATNGSDFSPIVTEVYATSILNNTRLGHSATTASAGTNLPALYPFGSNSNQPNGAFTNPGNAGITINNPSGPQHVAGYDADGYANSFTNKPYTIENYQITYSNRDAQGQAGPGIGNISATSIILQEPSPPESTNDYSNMFDPRAMVIFQDASKENPEDPPHINRQFFSLQDNEKVRDGANYYNSGLNAPTISGSFVRAHYNPRDNTLTHYYFDSSSCRWIISKAPYKPNGNYDGSLAGQVFQGGAAGKVFQWIPFQRRVLF